MRGRVCPFSASDFHKLVERAFGFLFLVFERRVGLHQVPYADTSAAPFDKFAKLALLPLLPRFGELGIYARGLITKPPSQVTRCTHGVARDGRGIRIARQLTHKRKPCGVSSQLAPGGFFVFAGFESDSATLVVELYKNCFGLCIKSQQLWAWLAPVVIIRLKQPKFIKQIQRVGANTVRNR